ncbi:MAG TPA: hypothetical protein VJ768_07700, partial [Anaerolineales bacterium]|nr:hypothetical protein [Anaerolineales bacterium]
SPGGLRTLWLTDYNELFIYPADVLSYQHLAEAGLMEIVRVRLGALGSNFVHTIVVQGQIILLPLAALGLWKYRRDLRVQVGVLVWIATFLAMSLAFPFPGVRGGLFHSGAAIQPLIWGAVPVGLDRLIDFGSRYRGWKPAQALPIFQAGILVLLLLTTFVVFQDRMFGDEANPTGWDGPFRRYQAVEEWLRENGADPHDPVLVNNPAGFFITSNRPAFVIPDAGLGVALAVAEEYGAEFLILESNHPHALAGLYITPTDQPGIRFLGTVEDSHIFRIRQEGEGSS